MRVAWFRPAAQRSDIKRDLDAVLADLATTHEIDVVDEAAAHRFVWRHARQPYDVCVYDLDDTPAHQYIWPYLLHVPGVVALRSLSLREHRARRLTRERRHAEYRAELAFSGSRLLRAPLAAARLVVVFDAEVGRALEREFPAVRIAVATAGVPAFDREAVASGVAVRFGVLDGRDDLVQRAAARARDAGARFEIVREASTDETLARCDVALALHWPPEATAPASALTAMAAGRPCVVYETEVTAVWPALDPQNWQPRDPVPVSAPAVVSLDPLDDEHSLMLAIRRLSADAELRRSLGAGARSWWQAHATVTQAAARWREILERAATMTAKARPANWPPHLCADGTERARAILDEFGARVDFLDF